MKKTTDNTSTARHGENLACEHLLGRGYDIVARNWSCKLGEIDVVASHAVPWGDAEIIELAVVEVKTSREPQAILPEAHVDAAKRRKLVALAKYFLLENDLDRVIVRFDVVGVTLEPQEIRHYPAAFDGSGRVRP